MGDTDQNIHHGDEEKRTDLKYVLKVETITLVDLSLVVRERNF